MNKDLEEMLLNADGDELELINKVLDSLQDYFNLNNINQARSYLDKINNYCRINKSKRKRKARKKIK